jgi:hypothetical protein
MPPHRWRRASTPPPPTPPLTNTHTHRPGSRLGQRQRPGAGGALRVRPFAWGCTPLPACRPESLHACAPQQLREARPPGLPRPAALAPPHQRRGDQQDDDGVLNRLPAQHLCHRHVKECRRCNAIWQHVTGGSTRPRPRPPTPAPAPLPPPPPPPPCPTAPLLPPYPAALERPHNHPAQSPMPKAPCPTKKFAGGVTAKALGPNAALRARHAIPLPSLSRGRRATGH